MKKYFYSDGVQKHGPFSLEELKGEGIREDTLIWFEGLEDWIPARKIEEILSFFALQIPPLPGKTSVVRAIQRNRNGFVMAWLIWGIIANAGFSSLYLFDTDGALMNLDYLMPTDSQRIMIIMLGILSLLNIVFYALLINWKKSGFEGLVIISIASLVINLSIGYDLIWSCFGIIGIVILYSLLQVKKNGVSSWQHMKKT
jgi:hypothetical protein